MPTLNLLGIEFDSAISELISRQGMIKIKFDDDEVVEMPVRKAIFHMIYWKVARKWGATITKNFIVDTTVVNSGTLSDIGTIILNAIRKVHPGRYHEVTTDFSEALNKLNNLVIDHCQEYHRSLNILDLARISQIPEISAITTDKVSDPSVSMQESEKKLKANFKRLFSVLKKPHPMNAIYPFVYLRFVSATQLAHIFYQIGFRTDINDTIVRYPVVGNYLDGLRNYIEYSLEALSAKKSSFYNLESIPTSEYFGRRQHLLLSNIRYLYPGDCGTQITIPMMVTDKIKDAVLWKNIIQDNLMITLDNDNISHFIGKQVNFRSPIGCRYQDGVCEICAGKLLSNVTPGIHIGIFSAIQTTEKVTQVILSSKHLQDTTAVEYIVPPEIGDYLTKKRGGIYVKSKITDKFKSVSLVFRMEDAMYLMNIHDMDFSRISSINESAFGRVGDIIFMKDGAPITDQIPMEVNGQKPLYSRHLVKYISSNPSKVVIRDELFMVDIGEFDFNQPLFKITVVNDSMVKFVHNAKTLLETDISTFTSAATLVNTFADMVYDHVKPNLSYLEVVLKAAMVRNELDLRLPVVTDIDDVRFGTNRDLNMYRSLGTLCAFQGLRDALAEPSFYITPKLLSGFDDFLNLKPKSRTMIP